MPLTLVHSPQSRSSTFLWLLEELGADYDIQLATIRRAGSEEGLDPANPHPHGKVPVIIHDGVVIHEQTAIALFLTDLFPNAGLGPLIGDPKRGPYLTWLAYYSGVAEPSFMSKFMNVDVPRGTAGWVGLDELIGHIEATLTSQPYLLGDTFSAADVLFGSTFNMFGQSPIMPKSQIIAEYANRCIQRPARAAAQAKENG